MSEVATHFEGHANRECGEHRTVGSHRAWCHDCTEWCYPEIPCRGCKIPQLEAELEATQRLVQAAHNWQEEGFTHWALTPAVEGYKDATEKGDTETLSWKARAEQNYAEWEEANKLLEQTIEVLGIAIWALDSAELNARIADDEHVRRDVRIGIDKALSELTPLLDNLKALKKEPDVHQQAVAEMLAPKPIDHVDGGFKP